MASSIGVIEEVMVDNGLLDADVMTRRNIRLLLLLKKLFSHTSSSVYLLRVLLSGLLT